MKTAIALSLLLACPACTRADAGEPAGASLLQASAPLATASASSTAAPEQTRGPEQTSGIKALSLRPTMNGSMLDFRFTVLDPEKARPLFDRSIKPYLFDPSSGVAVGPEDTKLGTLRASLRNPPVAGKRYYVLFSNPYGTVKRGSRVTVVFGDCKLEDVVVE